MIHARPQSPHCWALYATETDDHGHPHQVAAWVLEWLPDSPRAVLFHGWRGKLTRATLRSLVRWLVAHEIDEVRAGESHVQMLPGAVIDDQGVAHVSVPALAHRLATPGASDWVDL